MRASYPPQRIPEIDSPLGSRCPSRILNEITAFAGPGLASSGKPRPRGEKGIGGRGGRNFGWIARTREHPTDSHGISSSWHRKSHGAQKLSSDLASTYYNFFSAPNSGGAFFFTFQMKFLSFSLLYNLRPS